MSAITTLAESGMWDYQNIVAPISVGTPLVAEGIGLLSNIVRNPSYLKEKLAAAQGLVIDSFTQREEESAREAACRIVKNALITISCLAVMGSVAYLSIYLLPASMGISTAISAIIIVGKLFINAPHYKNQLIDAFKAREGEDTAEAKKRIFKSIIKTAVIGTCLGASAAVGLYVLIPLLHKFSWSVSLPFQTKVVVLLEYLALAIIHIGIAAHKYRKGDKAKALFHLMAAVSAVAFPIFYWNTDMRLHHSFMGLALMALPSRTAKWLGSIITMDSALYALAPVRGGVDAAGQFHSYDFINIIVDRFSLFFNSIVSATITENVNRNWSPQRAENWTYQPIQG